LCSPVRMEFFYTVVLKATQTISATGRSVHAAIGRDGRPCRLPANVREALA